MAIFQWGSLNERSQLSGNTHLQIDVLYVKWDITLFSVTRLHCSYMKALFKLHFITVAAVDCIGSWYFTVALIDGCKSLYQFIFVSD